MTHWLRELAPPLRYAVYAAGTLLAFLVSIGLGAAVALVVGSPPEYTRADSTGIEAPERGSAESSQGPASEGATSGSSGGAESTNLDNREGPVEGASFVHTASGANSRGDYTYLSHQSIDGDPDAVALVVATRGAGGVPYGHNVGVWFEPKKKKWAIFNQDLAAVPARATFWVVIPRADRGFVHRAEPTNTEGNATYIDDPLLNGNPDSEVSVTQNWNPGGGNGVYNDHPVGVRYVVERERWAIYNGDPTELPVGAAFNVAVSAGDDSRRTS